MVPGDTVALLDERQEIIGIYRLLDNLADVVVLLSDDEKRRIKVLRSSVIGLETAKVYLEREKQVLALRRAEINLLLDMIEAALCKEMVGK